MLTQRMRVVRVVGNEQLACNGQQVVELWVGGVFWYWWFVGAVPGYVAEVVDVFVR